MSRYDESSSAHTIQNEDTYESPDNGYGMVVLSWSISEITRGGVCDAPSEGDF